MKKTMRKMMILVAVAVLLPTMLRAQMDTVQWGCNRYHYSLWYDTLPEFFTYYLHEDWPGLKLWEWTSDRHNQMLAMPQHVDGPTLVYGVSVTEPIVYPASTSSITRNDWYLPEYVYLFQKVGDTVVLLDSARWDTVPPKVMKLALNADTQRYGFGLVKVYEAMFKEPVTVDSVFYTLSSNNGRDAHCGSTYFEYEYRPVLPMDVHHHGPIFGSPWCPKPSWWDTKVFDFQTRQWLDYTLNNITSPIFGMYFPIVDYVELIVEPADTAMGTAGPVAHVGRNTSQDIWARPKRGYRFSHWQEDGGVYATRSVYVAQDTVRYTAVFETAARCLVEGRSDDESTGYVTVEDSVYYEGDTAMLEAYAAEGYVFDHWSTGDTANPLRIVVTGNMVVTAYFESRGVGILSADGEGGAFVLSPNPARGQVTVTLTEGFEGGTLAVRDAAGREVLRKELARGTRKCVLDVSGLPSGTYFVTLTTAKDTGTQKLVIN